MQRGKFRFVSRVAIVAAVIAIGQVASAQEEMPMSKEMKSMVDFQCHGAKTLQQAEANLARMSRDYTDQHPVIACLKKKIDEMKGGAK
jgi:hypothetical protein